MYAFAPLWFRTVRRTCRVIEPRMVKFIFNVIHTSVRSATASRLDRNDSCFEVGVKKILGRPEAQSSFSGEVEELQNIFRFLHVVNCYEHRKGSANHNRMPQGKG